MKSDKIKCRKFSWTWVFIQRILNEKNWRIIIRWNKMKIVIIWFIDLIDLTLLLMKKLSNKLMIIRWNLYGEKGENHDHEVKKISKKLKFMERNFNEINWRTTHDHEIKSNKTNCRENSWSWDEIFIQTHVWKTIMRWILHENNWSKIYDRNIKSDENKNRRN